MADCGSHCGRYRLSYLPHRLQHVLVRDESLQLPLPDAVSQRRQALSLVPWPAFSARRLSCSLTKSERTGDTVSFRLNKCSVGEGLLQETSDKRLNLDGIDLISRRHVVFDGTARRAAFVAQRLKSGYHHLSHCPVLRLLSNNVKFLVVALFGTTFICAVHFALTCCNDIFLSGRAASHVVRYIENNRTTLSGRFLPHEQMYLRMRIVT